MKGLVRNGIVREKEKCETHSVVCDFLWPCGPYSPWNSPGKNTRVGSHSPFQEIFSTRGLNPGLLHCGWVFFFFFFFLLSELPGDLPIVRKASTKIRARHDEAPRGSGKSLPTLGLKGEEKERCFQHQRKDSSAPVLRWPAHDWPQPKAEGWWSPDDAVGNGLVSRGTQQSWDEWEWIWEGK